MSILVGYHFKISFKNATTNEEIKQSFYGYKYNPYDSLSRIKNFTNRLFRSKIPRVPKFKPCDPIHSEDINLKKDDDKEMNSDEFNLISNKYNS